MSTPKRASIAFFISAHGFGHAARSCAVMNAISARRPDVRFEIFTGTPRWFFEESVSAPFGYHREQTDIGVVQKNSIEEDLPGTLRALAGFLPFDRTAVERLARTLQELRVRLLLCDIAPLGICVAREAGIPVTLIENFTWDWIYEGYRDREKRLGPAIRYLSEWFRTADYRVQVRPVCLPLDADCSAGPVSRAPRTAAPDVRARLGVSPGNTLVLITMGGIAEEYGFLDRLLAARDIVFAIPGASERIRRKANLVLLPHHSSFFHPDLVHAANAVIGKIGYSTLAETYHAGVPFGFVARPRFREANCLANFARSAMPSLPIDPATFRAGTWMGRLRELLSCRTTAAKRPNGADEVAEFVVKVPALTG